MIGLLLDGRYHIIQSLSCGGFGLTYLAEDTKRPGRPQCVVKQLRPPSNDPKTVQVARHLFKTEAENLERLGQYDQIPRLFAYFEENQEFYLVQEFIPGHPLTQELLPGQPLPEFLVINLLIEVLEILVFVHGQGVIHRDIKPPNLMRRQTDEKIVLIDFGAVKDIATQIVNSEGQITSTVAVGTQGYMPTEQFHGKPQFNSDIYALGVIGIQALTGLHANDISRLRDPKNPSTGEIRWRHRSQVSPELANIIDKMVRFDCRQRYQSATQVLNDLTKVNKTQRLPEEPTPVSRRPKAIWLTLAGAAALIVVGGLTWWKFIPKPSQQCETYNQGVQAIEKQDYKQAINDFDQCIRSNPKDGEAYLYRGYAHYALKDYNRAIEDDQQALDNFEQQKQLIGIGVRFEKRNDRLTVARVYYGSPALAAGVKVGDQILEIDGKPTDNMSQEQALSLIRQGKLNTPVTLRIAHEGGNDFKLTLNRIAIADNIRAKVYINRGLAWSGQGNKNKAFDDFNQALKLQPNSAEAYYERSRVRSDLRDKQGAIDDLNKATLINTNYIEAYLSRGSVRFDLGEKQGAIGDYTQAIQINSAPAYSPDYVNKLHAAAYNSRGYVRYQLTDKQGAIEDYTKAIQLNSDYDSAYYNRGIVRSDLTDKQGAVKDFQKAANLYLDHQDTKHYNDALSQITKLQH